MRYQEKKQPVFPAHVPYITVAPVIREFRGEVFEQALLHGAAPVDEASTRTLAVISS